MISARRQLNLAPRSRRSLSGRRGATLFVVIMVGLLLFALVGSVLQMTNHQTRDRIRYETYKDEFAASEEVLNKAFGHIQFLIRQGSPDFFGEVEAMTPPTVQGLEFPTFNVAQTFNGAETITSGQWSGLSLNRVRYSIDVQAKKTDGAGTRFEHPGVALSQTFEITYIPLYIFAIFYDPTMEFSPIPNMYVNGRVHTNSDAFLTTTGSGNSLNIEDRITVAGNLNKGTAFDFGWGSSSGDVTLFDGSGQSSMAGGVDDDNGDGWLDANDEGWTQSATERWNVNVADSSHGVAPLDLPIPTIEDPRAIIERADPANDGLSLQQEKFEYKAGTVIEADGSGRIMADVSGGPDIDLAAFEYHMVAGVPTLGPDPFDSDNTKRVAEFNTFYDARQGDDVSSLDINIANMIEAASLLPGLSPDNGILYVTNEDSGSDLGVVRLLEGSRLPDSVPGGFTVATDDPIYVQGDFNTVDRKMSMILSDALSILSNDWEDVNSRAYGQRRVAGPTEMNFVSLTGNVPSTDDRGGPGRGYSGGVENYFRFLEDWRGNEYVYSGSIINLWESVRATAQFSNPSRSGNSNAGIYYPPVRVWEWDTALGGTNGPPGAPYVVQIERTRWTLTGYDG